MESQAFSPALFSFLIALFLSLFITFRILFIKTNLFFSLAGFVSCGWFYLMWSFPEADERSVLILILAIPNIFLSLIYLAFSILGAREEKTFLSIPRWTPLFISLELLTLSLLTIFLSLFSFFSLDETILENIFTASLLTSFFFGLINGFIALHFSFCSLKNVLEEKLVFFERTFSFCFFLSLIIFSFFYTSFLSNIYFLSSSDFLSSFLFYQEYLPSLIVPAALGIIIFMASFLHHKYFLSYKVSFAQILGSSILVLSLISIWNSTNTENFVLRSILFVVFAALSYFLVKSVLSEIEKKEAIKTTSEEIFQANKSLKSLDQAKSDFIASASHQLRSPLSVIKGVSSMLIDGSYGKIENAPKEALTKVFISNERLIGLIEDLLDVSHLDEGKVEFTFEKKDINEIASKAVMGLGLQSKSKKLYLRFKPYKSPLLVWVDEHKMTEVISNLIDNAIKYTRKGGITVEIKKVGKLARVKVRDTGIGLKKEEINHLFERFVRAGRGKKLSTVGTGLGLYVAKKMTLAQKAKIWVESAGEGKGSTFIIEFKLNLASPPDEKFIQSVLMEKGE